MPPDLPSPRDGRANFDLVAIAASLGGLAALGQVLGALPDDFPAPVVVVQHRAPRDRGESTERVIALRSRLPVERARAGDVPRGGRVYVAPPGHHLLVGEGGALALSDALPVHFARPAADPLLASAAARHGARTVAVVLTGRGEDGARGAREVRGHGGVVIVQDPGSCAAPSMPRAVLLGGGADFVLPPEAIAAALVGLVMVPGAPALFGLEPAPAPVAAPLS